MFGFIKTGFQKIKSALSKTRAHLTSRLKALFGRPWDESTFDALEQILFEADLGSECVTTFIDHLRAKRRTQPIQNVEEILQLLKEYASEILSAPSKTSNFPSSNETPHVILVVGVNGSGKTTSIAKLASHYQKAGKKVMLAAGDTFRAAAIDQLALWATRLQIDIVKSQPGSDPAAVAFDAVMAAKTRGIDLLIIDTAGRLQNKTDLMRELEKVRRVCHKALPNAPHETLLVIDATTGQNALDQTEIFHQFTPLTGLLLAKVDGSAKGGIVLSIYRRFGIPIQWIGTGELAEDLEPFDAAAYVDALF